MKVSDHTNHFEIVGIEMVINQFHRLGEMITIGDHHLRIVLIHRDYNWLAIRQWINISTIYNGAYPQETQKCLVLARNDNIVGRVIDG